MIKLDDNERIALASLLIQDLQYRMALRDQAEVLKAFPLPKGYYAPARRLRAHGLVVGSGQRFRLTPDGRRVAMAVFSPDRTVVTHPEDVAVVEDLASELEQWPANDAWKLTGRVHLDLWAGGMYRFDELVERGALAGKCVYVCTLCPPDSKSIVDRIQHWEWHMRLAATVTNLWGG